MGVTHSAGAATDARADGSTVPPGGWASQRRRSERAIRGAVDQEPSWLTVKHRCVHPEFDARQEGRPPRGAAATRVARPEPAIPPARLGARQPPALDRHRIHERTAGHLRRWPLLARLPRAQHRPLTDSEWWQRKLAKKRRPRPRRSSAARRGWVGGAACAGARGSASDRGTHPGIQSTAHSKRLTFEARFGLSATRRRNGCRTRMPSGQSFGRSCPRPSRLALAGPRRS